MAYATEKLQSVAECDVLLNEVGFDIRQVELRLNSLDLRNDLLESTSSTRASEVAELQARIQVLDATLAVMPEGPEKEDTLTKKMEADLRLRRLTQANNASGPVAFVRREGDLGVLNVTLTALTNFKAALEARRQELV